MVKYKNVIVVDDDPVSNFISKLLLTRYHISENVFITEDTDQALNILKHLDHSSSMPDLVILDIQMPVKDGFIFMEEFNLKFKYLRTRTEICVLTNSSSSEDLSRMLQLGINYWITKPLKKEILENLAEMNLKLSTQ